MQQWIEKIIERLRDLPWWAVIFVVWLILGPGWVLLYNHMWGVLGTQKAVYVSMGPIALAVGITVALVLYHYFRDRD